MNEDTKRYIKKKCPHNEKESSEGERGTKSTRHEKSKVICKTKPKYVNGNTECEWTK